MILLRICIRLNVIFLFDSIYIPLLPFGLLRVGLRDVRAARR